MFLFWLLIRDLSYLYNIIYIYTYNVVVDVFLDCTDTTASRCFSVTLGAFSFTSFLIGNQLQL